MIYDTKPACCASCGSGALGIAPEPEAENTIVLDWKLVALVLLATWFVYREIGERRKGR